MQSDMPDTIIKCPIREYPNTGIERRGDLITSREPTDSFINPRTALQWLSFAGKDAIASNIIMAIKPEAVMNQNAMST